VREASKGIKPRGRLFRARSFFAGIRLPLAVGLTPSFGISLRRGKAFINPSAPVKLRPGIRGEHASEKEQHAPQTKKARTRAPKAGLRQFDPNEARVQPESVISVIESVADPALAEDWDPSGVQVAANRREISRLAVALDATPSIITRAVEWEADLILTHHPLSLNPGLPSRLDEYHASLRLLLGRDIWLYSAHTSLDLRTDGPVSWLARSLRLSHICPVAEIPGNEAVKTVRPLTGYGVQGTLPVPLGWPRFTQELSRITGLSCWRRTGEPPKEISQVAYCPGSGMGLARTAFANGADVFLSGDLKYHAAQEIESLGPTLDLGHFILEEIMMRTWASDLQTTLREHSVDVAFFSGHDPIVCETNQ